MSEDHLSPLAAFLIAQPEAVAVLLADHVGDDHGRCRVCAIGGQRGRTTWPCALYGAATAARAASTRRTT
jgi:hypothetical protein